MYKVGDKFTCTMNLEEYIITGIEEDGNGLWDCLLVNTNTGYAHNESEHVVGVNDCESITQAELNAMWGAPCSTILVDQDDPLLDKTKQIDPKETYSLEGKTLYFEHEDTGELYMLASITKFKKIIVSTLTGRGIDNTEYIMSTRLSKAVTGQELNDLLYYDKENKLRLVDYD